MAEAVEVQEVNPAEQTMASVPVGEGGGVLSPLSGAYLLVVLSEPMSEAHKARMVQKLRQGNFPSLLSARKHIYRLQLKTAERGSGSGLEAASDLVLISRSAVTTWGLEQRNVDRTKSGM